MVATNCLEKVQLDIFISPQAGCIHIYLECKRRTNIYFFSSIAIEIHNFTDVTLPNQLKNFWKSDRRWEPENFENLKTWKLENFGSIKNYPWDMLNNFCFHVYAQKSLFIDENCNAFFGTSSASCEFVNPRAGSQLIMSHSYFVICLL